MRDRCPSDWLVMPPLSLTRQAIAVKILGMGIRHRRPKKCTCCDKTFRPTGQNCKYCPSCRPEINKARCRERWHRTYIKKGRDQKGAKNNHWRGGSSPYYYQKLAYDHYGKICQQCGAEAALVHHKDGDRHNSAINNLEPLCKRCHQVDVHDCTSRLPQYQ